MKVCSRKNVRKSLLHDTYKDTFSQSRIQKMPFPRLQKVHQIFLAVIFQKKKKIFSMLLLLSTETIRLVIYRLFFKSYTVPKWTSYSRGYLNAALWEEGNPESARETSGGHLPFQAVQRLKYFLFCLKWICFSVQFLIFQDALWYATNSCCE